MPIKIHSVTDNVFVRRKRDGKYFRGSILQRWTKNWRRAAVLTIGFWQLFVQRGITDEVEFVDLNDLDL